MIRAPRICVLALLASSCVDSPSLVKERPASEPDDEPEARPSKSLAAETAPAPSPREVPPEANARAIEMVVGATIREHLVPIDAPQYAEAELDPLFSDLRRASRPLCLHRHNLVPVDREAVASLWVPGWAIEAGGSATARPESTQLGKASLLNLMAATIARLCDREQRLRSRVEELATLFSLTTEFTGVRDLQSVLDLVARTVVNVLKAKACSIRLLSEDQTELVIKAVAGLSPGYLNKGPILLSQSRIDREALTTGRCVYIADQRTDRGAVPIIAG